MLTGLDLGTVLLIAAAVLVVFFIIDLLLAGGGMSAGMMGGMAGMMGTPWGWAGLLLVVLVLAIGPMGPMGPIMGGGSWGDGIAWGLAFGFVVILLLALGLVVLAITHGGSPVRRRAPSPEETLRDRYARGEVTRQQYQQALVDLLKGRYLQGEISLGEYEAQLGRLFGDLPRARSDAPAHGPVSETSRVDGGQTMRKGGHDIVNDQTHHTRT